ncbi:MAG TPA: nuclear transport factor 2 family protein [Gemmatimonadaceae bacterium]|nr:nuclear transport factor 2 family protein [Gemmatimonadaceae bacterium]
MTTRETIERYFDTLSRRGALDALLADDVVFERLTNPPNRVEGRSAFLAATGRFYGSVATFDVRDVVVDDDRASTLTRYAVRTPTASEPFESYVAEFFVVRDGAIVKLSICFDMTPYPKT